MAVKRTRTLATWGSVVLSCALGCATGIQSDGLLTDPIDSGGSAGSAGAISETAGMSNAAAGTEAAGGSGGTSLAGFMSGGAFASGGTFGMGGTPSSSGSAGVVGAGAPAGGAAGASGSGGAAAGAGGQAGSGGVAGAGGKAGGNPCASTKLTITSATGTEENASLSPSFAIDGDMATRWASEKSEPQTLDLDLGEVVAVSRVLINWEAAYATNYELQIATNAAGPFTTIYTDAAGNGGTDDVTTLKVSDGRYLRMHGITRKTVYGFSIYEIAVYGDKDETCQ